MCRAHGWSRVTAVAGAYLASTLPYCKGPRLQPNTLYLQQACGGESDFVALIGSNELKDLSWNMAFLMHSDICQRRWSAERA